MTSFFAVTGKKSKFAVKTNKATSFMVRIFTFIALLLLFGSGDVLAQKKFGVYAVGFYNLENLFDTIHDEGKKDYEFLPDGQYKWNKLKYEHKLHNLSRVLSELGTDVLPQTVGCAVIGVSEVENSRVLDALTSQPELAARGYKYCHVEGPDRRGVDCALLYQPRFFNVRSVKLVPYVQTLEKDSAYYTRGFLTVSGTLAGDNVTIIVNHLPSRFNGSFYREQGAEQIKAIKDSILLGDPRAKVIVMGDMNDDPMDPSMAKALSAKAEIKDVGQEDMYNPWWNTLRNGTGTLLYDGKWNLFDQIILSPTLLCKDGKKDYTTLKYLKHQIFRRDYMIQQDGKYKGNPLRTHAGGVWLDGFSDHLPTVVYLVKEK